MGKFQKGQKLPGRRFQKGQSGNPSGKPKAIIEVTEAARARTIEAIETLTKIMRDETTSASARVSSAIALLERGWGKAPATVTLRHEGKLEDMSDAELIAIARGEATEPNGRGDAAPPPQGPSKPH